VCLSVKSASLYSLLYTAAVGPVKSQLISALSATVQCAHYSLSQAMSAGKKSNVSIISTGLTTRAPPSPWSDSDIDNYRQMSINPLEARASVQFVSLW